MELIILAHFDTICLYFGRCNTEILNTIHQSSRHFGLAVFDNYAAFCSRPPTGLDTYCRIINNPNIWTLSRGETDQEKSENSNLPLDRASISELIGTKESSFRPEQARLVRSHLLGIHRFEFSPNFGSKNHPPYAFVQPGRQLCLFVN